MSQYLINKTQNLSADELFFYSQKHLGYNKNDQTLKLFLRHYLPISPLILDNVLCKLYIKCQFGNIIQLSIKLEMSKRIFKMVIPIENSLRPKKNTKNIYRYINRVPCDLDEYNRPSESVTYVNQELSEYPFSKRLMNSQAINIQSTLKQKNKETKIVQLAQKLEKKIGFLEIQELRELVPSLTKYQAKQHQNQLKSMAYRLNYNILKGEINESHIIQQAKLIIEQLERLLKGKINTV